MGIAAKVDQWIHHNHNTILGWRRHLHSHPELSNMEYRTTDYLAEVLRDHGLKPQRFPGTGLMVDIGPSQGSRLAFRGDIDALPITETTDLEFKSQEVGVMHACGHDVHATLCLGLACALAECAEDLDVGIRIIFQPAEEVMDGGAPQVITWGALEDVSAIYAVHVEPKLKVGQIGLRVGAITSASDIVTIKVSGPGGHSSRPHLSADVVYALGKLATDLPGLFSRRVDPRTGTVLVFGSINAGYAPNAIPETGEISGTLRTADIGVWRSIQPVFEELVQQVLAPTGCHGEVIYTRGVPPVQNDDVATALMADAVRSIDPSAIVQAPQSSGGEDFSWYLEHVPGSMARLGCWDGRGSPQDLHQADLRVDERCLDIGIRLFGAVVDQYQASACRGEFLN
ncbi:amidohydrolase [Corynebacterium sp. 3HC-13]|uniref:M20 family metallopeptidase n=1 Tax=Corynebacterium poyangense TaxID=2684405 RepID=UPI001CCA5A93|nr:M20 family metallopeptidase [Corynebacterium poyangense]MBZ8176821.1 amidohydrolase [Corynebacterium poyangense]